MNTYVAIPISAATLRLYVDKGRKWNAVEHLLLFSLSSGPQLAESLVKQSSLPWRVIVEVMSRLMRVGWVELETSKEGVTFQITAAGQAVVMNDVLPAVTRPLSRRAGFSIDKITGTVFKAKELNARSKTYLQKLKAAGQLIELTPIPGADKFSPDEVINALLEEDEHCRGIEPLGSRFVDSFAVVAINDGEIEGLPSIAPPRLRQAILNAASSHTVQNGAPTSASDDRGAVTDSQLNLVDLRFEPTDLLIGGAEHLAHFKKMLERATSWIVIHSTFITADRFEALVGGISEAALRGVRIDILWGKSDAPDGSNSTELEVDRCRDMLTDEIVQERVRLHHFTTNSHAKLLLADNGKGVITATIGSCNWLSSSYGSVEVSVKISDSWMVGEIASKLSKLAMGDYGRLSQVVGDLAALAANLKRKESTSAKNASGAIVLGSDHNNFMQRARDLALSRIRVVSHKVSKNADTLVIDPMMGAIQGRDVKVELLYSELAHASDESNVNGMFQVARAAGMKVTQVSAPNVHAKFLAWDDDNVLITSQNLLSADPMESTCSEIGVFISAKGVATHLADRFEQVISGN